MVLVVAVLISLTVGGAVGWFVGAQKAGSYVARHMQEYLNWLLEAVDRRHRVHAARLIGRLREANLEVPSDVPVPAIDELVASCVAEVNRKHEAPAGLSVDSPEPQETA